MREGALKLVTETREEVVPPRAPISVLLVGDGPNLPTGLARILRELGAHLKAAEARLGIRVSQIGWGYDGSPQPWPCFPMHDPEQWGKNDAVRTTGWVRELNPARGPGALPTVVFSAWDAGRCYGFTQDLLPYPEQVRLWGYFPIDAENPVGRIGGAAGETLRTYDRVLGYGAWGAGVIKRTCPDFKEEKVPFLPHGLGAVWFEEQEELELESPLIQALVEQHARGTPILGCVAQNQPRKDFGLVFETAGLLRANPELENLLLWIHTDRQVTKGWSLPELAEIYGFNSLDRLVVSLSASDEELAAAYQLCSATIAPGRGEGFGYPIVESLACGTPVVGGDCAGGAEYIPEQWRVAPRGWHVEGAYAEERPFFGAADFAGKLASAIRWVREEPETCREWCRGAVANLRWEHLWPRWEAWFRRGLEELREGKS